MDLTEFLLYAAETSSCHGHALMLGFAWHSCPGILNPTYVVYINCLLRTERVHKLPWPRFDALMSCSLSHFMDPGLCSHVLGFELHFTPSLMVATMYKVGYPGSQIQYSTK